MRILLSIVKSSVLIAIVLASSIPTDSHGCDNPVFRYALQNWAPADFELLLVKSNELSTDESAAWAMLEQAIAQTTPRPNLRLQVVPRAELSAASEPSYQSLLAASEGNVLALISPSRSAGSQLVWSGPCSAENVQGILQSPAREELAKRLLDGEAIVWILLETADQSANNAALASLETFLVGYSETVALSDAQAAAEAAQRPAIPSVNQPTTPPVDKSAFWPPRFSTINIAPDDPREVVLVSLLKHSVDTLPTNEPIVFPVFGQGRVLGGMPISQVNPVSLRSACDFLTGACSCEVKDKNPGDDLLLVADWSSVAAQNGPTGLISLLALEPEAPDSPPAETPTVKVVPEAAVVSEPEAANPSPDERQSPSPKASSDSQSTVASGRKPNNDAPKPSTAVPAEPLRLSWIAGGAVVFLLLIGYLTLRRSS